MAPKAKVRAYRPLPLRICCSLAAVAAGPRPVYHEAFVKTFNKCIAGQYRLSNVSSGHDFVFPKLLIPCYEMRRNMPLSLLTNWPIYLRR
eukprot:scaffold19380_cov32-Prasinocladus_malaysianus.AAC.3